MGNIIHIVGMHGAHITRRSTRQASVEQFQAQSQHFISQAQIHNLLSQAQIHDPLSQAQTHSLIAQAQNQKFMHEVFLLDRVQPLQKYIDLFAKHKAATNPWPYE